MSARVRFRPSFRPLARRRRAGFGAAAPALATLLAALAATAPAVAQGPPEPSAAPAETAPAAAADGDLVEAAYLFARAKLLAEKGDFEEALAAFERSLELDGADPYALVELARFQTYLAQISSSQEQQLERLQRAAAHAGRAREMAPANLDVLRSFARVHLRLMEHGQQGSLTLAEKAFEELRRRTEGDLQVLSSLGQLYLWQSRHAEAVEVLREAASLLPRHPTIQNMLVEALLGAGDPGGAEEVLARYLADNPDAVEHRLQLAELLSERGDHRGAVEALRQAPAGTRTSTRLRRVLVRELHLSGVQDEALDLVDALLEETSGGYGLRRLRVAILSSMARYDEAILALEPLVEEQPPESGQTLADALLLARLLERVGRAPEAVERMRRLAGEQKPGQESLRVTIALVGALEREGRSDEAVALLEGELDAADEATGAALSRLLGQLLVRAGRGGEALELADRALERYADGGDAETLAMLRLERLAALEALEDWPRLAEEAPELFDAEAAGVRIAARLVHAEALARTDRLEEALAGLRAAEEELEPQEIGARDLLAKRVELLYENGLADEARALLAGLTGGGGTDELLAAARIHQAGERYDEAVPLLERVLAAEPDSQPALFLLGAALERSGRAAEAAEAFQRLLERAPDHAPTLNYLGYMWAERGENLREALELIQRAVAIEPDNGAYVDSLGWVYYQLGRYEEARRHLEWARRLVPDDPTILEHLGDVYASLEELELARASYRQALDLGGDTVDGVRRKLLTLEEKGL